MVHILFHPVFHHRRTAGEMPLGITLLDSSALYRCHSNGPAYNAPPREAGAQLCSVAPGGIRLERRFRTGRRQPPLDHGRLATPPSLRLDPSAVGGSGDRFAHRLAMLGQGVLGGVGDRGSRQHPGYQGDAGEDPGKRCPDRPAMCLSGDGTGTRHAVKNQDASFDCYGIDSPDVCDVTR